MVDFLILRPKSSLLLMFFICISSSVSWAQPTSIKPIVDTGAVNHWKRLFTPAISNNGQYAGYIVDEHYERNELVIKQLNGKWEIKIPVVKSYQFSSDSKSVYILDKHGRLLIQHLGTNENKTINDVISFKLFISSKSDWLIYTDKSNKLFLKDLKANNMTVYDHVINFYLSKDRTKLVLTTEDNNRFLISVVQLKNLRQYNIGQYNHIRDVILDTAGNNIAYLTASSTGIGFILWHYCLSEHLTKEVKQERFLVDGDTMVIKRLVKFSNDGKRIFLSLKYLTDKTVLPSSNVLVWKYSDFRLKSQELKDKAEQSNLSIINLGNHQVNILERQYESARFLSDLSDEFLDVVNRPADLMESQWNKYAVGEHFIVSTLTLKRQKIPFDEPWAISPDDRFVVGRNQMEIGLRLYDLITGTTIPLTKSIEKNFRNDFLHNSDKEYCSFAGWYEDGLIIYDSHDIWRIKTKHPEDIECVTNGFGRKNNLSFRFASKPQDNVYKDRDLLLLNCFDNQTKQNGFYELSKSNPRPLCMEDWFINVRGPLLPNDPGALKAKNKNIWLLKIEKRNHTGNYFTTSDFRKFSAVSDIYSEDKYQWVNAELLNFNDLNGSSTQAVLYKPENFDSTKQYPVIISCYEKFSKQLNRSVFPEISANRINIPWFVSRGYLVCTPDITYVEGQTGQSCVNTVEGLYNQLGTLSYVDTAAIGLHGHSFGGYETNFIVTHSNKFKAAVSAAGFSDLISDYLSIRPESGSNFQAWRSEKGMGRIGASLWLRPDLYSKNSPVLFAPQVVTPLLMMSNEKDDAVNFSQGLEFFIALRQLGKYVWLLSYKDEGHSLAKIENQLDYTQRMEGFYGHYLKGEPMPDWMKPHN